MKKADVGGLFKLHQGIFYEKINILNIFQLVFPFSKRNRD